eukprot:scaffold163039_cov21-Tisochrysis_lutea.AAC.1
MDHVRGCPSGKGVAKVHSARPVPGGKAQFISCGRAQLSGAQICHVSDEEEGKGFSWPNVEVVIWVDVLILLFQPCRFFDYKITRAQGANGLKRDICCGACEATDGFLII